MTRKPPTGKTKDVDAYLEAAPEGARPILQELRRLVLETVPDAQESISYGVPHYHRHREYLAAFAAHKGHVGFGFGEGGLTGEERDGLAKAGYRLGLVTLQVRFGQAVPADALVRFLRRQARAAEEEGREASRASRRSSRRTSYPAR
jgi:uncharacterized protein